MTIGKPFKGSPQPTPVDWARLALGLVGTRATFDDTAQASSGGFRLLSVRHLGFLAASTVPDAAPGDKIYSLKIARYPLEYWATLSLR